MHNSQVLAFDLPGAFFSSSPTIKAAVASPGQLISLLLPNVIIVSGIVFFVMILFGGFGMITSAGKQSSPQEMAKSKNAITYGVIGFLLVVSAYFILQIVSTIMAVNLMNPPTP